MTAWLGHGPLGSPGGGYSYGGLVLVPLNVRVPYTRATSRVRTVVGVTERLCVCLDFFLFYYLLLILTRLLDTKN